MSYAKTRNGKAPDIKIYLVVNIDKNSLQLIGIASIYIASKIVECLPLNTDTCVMYTDYSVTKVCTSGPFSNLLPVKDLLPVFRTN